MGGNTREWAAGVLPVSARPGGGPVVLLGKDVWYKGWKFSDFVGGSESCDTNPVQTAVRELFEETGGLVRLSESDLDDALCLLDTTPSGKPVHRFVAVIPYDESLPARFTDTPPSTRAEKDELAWFPLDAGLDALPAMRPVFARQMRRDLQAIAAHLGRRLHVTANVSQTC